MQSSPTPKKPPTLVSLPNADALQRSLEAQSTKPSLALFFHTRGDASRALALVTAHRVGHDRHGRAQVREGRPLSPEDEIEVLRLLRPRAASDGFRVLPPGLLHHSGSETMWWLPPQRYPMTFSTGKAVTTRNVAWPNLVLMASQQRLYVAAFKGDQRPTEDTPLFHAPLANVWASAEVCTGNATLPDTCDVESIDAWTSVLRDSAFSHANHNDVIAGKGKQRRCDPMEWWRSTRAKQFPDSHLLPLRCSLRDFIDYTQTVGRR